MGEHEKEPLASVLTCYISAVAICFFIGAAGIVFMVLMTKRRHACNSLVMPGPWSFPIVGCLCLFRWSPSPHKILSWLTWIYGNVYKINLGGTQIVIVNSIDTIKEVLYQKSRDFAGRPQLFSLTLWGGEDSLMVKDFSPEFQSVKYKAEISLQELLNKDKSFISRSTKAITSLVDNFTNQGLHNNSFCPDNGIRDCVSDFIMDCIFGQSVSRWFYHEARIILEQTSTAYVKTAYPGACIDFVPIMRYLSTKTVSATSSHLAEFRIFVRKVYQLHLASTLRDSDYTESLAFILRSQDNGYRLVSDEKSSAERGLNDDLIEQLLCDIMFKAYEKICTCLEWCVARLASNPILQHEIVQELKEHDFGVTNASSRLLAATINETFRTTCVLPFGIPHKTTRDTTLNGYKIPKDTIIFLNLWSCCNDEQYFSKPNEFNPYRFISNKNNAEKLPSFCCFSGGERKCLGDTFSRMFLTSLAGTLVREFDLVLATPASCASLEGPYGLTLRTKRYTIYARKRTSIVHSEDS